MDTGGILFIIVMILCLVVTIGSVITITCLEYVNEHTIEVKSIITIQDNEHTLYKCTLIDDSIVILTNDDLLFKGKYNSSDIAVTLQEAEKNNTSLKLLVCGVRIPFFSMYENIIKII